MVSWGAGSPGGSRLAVLSYHSWDVSPEAVIADIRAARDDGWRFVSAREAVDFVHGRLSGDTRRLALVTSDDGHVEDEEFRAALRRERCPGVTFVNVGRMAPERFAWYRASHDEAWSVQDHGPLHRRHFVSGHITDIVCGQKLGGLEYLGLPMGAPVLASAGQLSAPRFEPHPDVMALAAEWARDHSPADFASDRWRMELAKRLSQVNLAYRWRGRIYVTGKLEAPDAFAQRVRREVVEGCDAFEAAMGRRATMFAYPWWQGNALADRALAEAGYEMTFAGTGRVQGAGMSPYSVPRIIVEPATPRPLALSAVDERRRRDWTVFRRGVEQAAKRMMGVI